jgi:DNA-binding transcriptional LysR family regulator
MSEMIGRPGFHATVTIGAPRKLLPMLLDESAHICVCTGRDLSSHAMLVRVPLARFPISLIVRSAHPLTQLARVNPSDLDRYPLLRTRSLEMDDDDPASSSDGLPKIPVLAIEDYDVLMKITSNSDAIWVASPISAEEGIMNGTLTQIPIPWHPETPFAQMTAYHLKGRTLSLTAQRILERLVSLSKEIIGPSIATA